MRRLMGDDTQRERGTQQRLVSRIANANKVEIRKALTSATRAAASELERNNGAAFGIGSAIEGQRERIKDSLEAMYSGAWGTFSKRITRAAFEKSAAGAGEFKMFDDDEDDDDDEITDLLDEAQRAFIAHQVAQQIESVISSTNRSVDSTIIQATRDGVGVDEIARRIRSTGRDMAVFRSEMIARTEVHKAAMAAQDEAARAAGVADRREWVAAIDGRTRHKRFSHIDADGETVGIDKWFQNTGEPLRYPGDSAGSAGNIINCFPADTAVRGRFVAGTRSLYTGPMVYLKTRAGRRLATTPNHPVMTSRGLVSVGEVAKGDHLVADRNHVEIPIGVARDHDEHGPAAIEQVFDALDVAGSLRAARVRGEDFHGDGIRHQGHVQIVSVDRELVFGVDAALAKSLDNLGLEQTTDARVCEGSLTQLLRRPLFAAYRVVRSLGESLALLGRAPALLNTVSVGAGSYAETGSGQKATDDASVNPVHFGEGVLRGTSAVTLDEVVSVDIGHWSGHVYSLQERSGLMTANGIITSNCRCGVSFVID